MKKIRDLLKEAKSRSTCHAIQLGVVIEAPGGENVLGWNGPPGRAGAHPACRLGDTITPDNIRNCPGVHAEVRAICRAAESGIAVGGGTLYLSEWYPCAPCAIAMIEAGIAKLIIAEEKNFQKDDCYNFHLAEEYLARSGVLVEVKKDLKG